MKRVVFTVCACWLLLAIDVNAQLLKGYGIKCALTSSTHSIDYTSRVTLPSSERRVGFNIALYAEWLEIPFFSLITQVEYDQRGYRETYYQSAPPPAVYVTKLANQRIDYLSVPLLAKLTFPLCGMQPYIFAGPRLDIKLDYQKTYLGDQPTPPYSEFKANVFGSSVGVGLTFPKLAVLPFLLEFRYNSDFSNSYQTNFSTFKNNAYDVWLGVEL